MNIPDTASPLARDAADSIATAAVSGIVPPEIVETLPEGLEVELPVRPLGAVPPEGPEVTLPEDQVAEEAPVDEVPPDAPPPTAAAETPEPAPEAAIAGLEASGTLAETGDGDLAGLVEELGAEDSVLFGGDFLSGLLTNVLGGDLSGFGHLASIAAGDLPGVAGADQDLSATPPFAGLGDFAPSDVPEGPLVLGDVLPDLDSGVVALTAMAPETLPTDAPEAPLDGLPVADSAPPSVSAPDDGLATALDVVPPQDPFADVPPVIVPPDPADLNLADAGMVDPNLPVF